MTVANSLDDAFLRVLAILEGRTIPHAVVGGLARNAWARPRATTDADFAVILEVPQVEPLLDELARAGLMVRRASKVDPSDEVPDLLLLRTAGEIEFRVDLLVAKTPFEMSALGRKVRTTVANHECDVVSAEDLLVYKLIAGRPRDLADADDVARARRAAGAKIDWSYVRRWVAEFGYESRVDDLERQLGPT